MRIDLASDNVAGASPAIIDAIARVNAGTASPYGADEETARLTRALADTFETDVAVIPVASGTAANALALAAAVRSFEAVACTDCAHILSSECGAPEFFSGGAKMITVGTVDGRMDPAALADTIAEARGHGVHQSQIRAVSLTQATEWGTVYRVDEVRALSEVARRHDLVVHMDGARFANALVSLGDARPAEITWRAGVDVLSFGATKNGAIAAEAIVVFRPDLARTLDARRKQSGHLWSKNRFLSAQLTAYLADDLWLDNARHANLAAHRLAEGLAACPGVALRCGVEANEVFARVPVSLADRLERGGVGFYRWGNDGDGVTIRLVASFATTTADIDAVLAIARNA